MNIDIDDTTTCDSIISIEDFRVSEHSTGRPSIKHKIDNNMNPIRIDEIL
jgi:hypothetical protein